MTEHIEGFSKSHGRTDGGFVCDVPKLSRIKARTIPQGFRVVVRNDIIEFLARLNREICEAVRIHLQGREFKCSASAAK
jgi:hypothetical protein